MSNAREVPAPSPKPSETSFAFADITTIVPVLRSMKLVTLVTAPDLGFGQPPDSPGLLAGSVPSTQAFAEGLQEVTGQLMALGFATSKVVFPNHSGVYPPTDRISVLTCMSPPPTFALSLTLWQTGGGSNFAFLHPVYRIWGLVNSIQYPNRPR